MSNGEEQKKTPNGEETNEKQHEETSTITEDMESVKTGCCQGTSSISCCREVRLEEKLENLKQNFSRRGVNKNGSICKLSCWVGKWQQRELLTTVDVVGVVATVVVAYVYKRFQH